jgi:hypothetical protein
MRPETILKIEFEISQIDMLLNETSPLLKLALNKTPDTIETAALGLFLQSFYNGIENIIKFIMAEKYEKLPSGVKWHKELLDLCFVEIKDQSKLFSDKLKDVLDDYLRFRHFIRNTYSYKIKWERMEELIINVNENWKNIKSEIVEFIELCRKQPNGI